MTKQYLVTYDLNDYHSEVKKGCTSRRDGTYPPFSDLVVTSPGEAKRLPNTTLMGWFDSAAAAASTFNALAREAAPKVIVKKLVVCLWSDSYVQSDDAWRF
jgi:hypothetical protein